MATDAHQFGQARKISTPAARDEQQRSGCEEGEGGRFGSGNAGVGDGLAEVVEDVGEVGEVDGRSAVEVAAGPLARGLTEVVEDGGEVREVDAAVDVGVAEEFGG